MSSCMGWVAVGDGPLIGGGISCVCLTRYENRRQLEIHTKTYGKPIDGGCDSGIASSSSLR